MNAVKHGMYSAAVVLPGESHQEYDALLARYLDHFRPTSPDQEHLVHTLASADWRIKRLVHIQTTKLAERIERQPDEGRDPVTQAYSFEVRHSEALLTADKHEARLQRDYDRALRRLLEIEKRRAQTKNQRNELQSAQAAGRGLHERNNSADLAASRESVVRELLESAPPDASPEPPVVSTETSETTNASVSAAQPEPHAPQPAAILESGPQRDRAATRHTPNLLDHRPPCPGELPRTCPVPNAGIPETSSSWIPRELKVPCFSET
jgi:hypothetical protein